jgi:hypothetical protein
MVYLKIFQRDQPIQVEESTGSNQQVCNFLLQFNYLIHNVSKNVLDMQSLLSGQSLALCKREIASSGPNCALLP